MQTLTTAAASSVQPGLLSITQLAQLAGCLPAGRYGLDLETTGLNPRESKVVTLAFGRPGSVYILDCRPFYSCSAEEQRQWRTTLASLLHRSDIDWIGHNLKFDWQFLSHHFGVQLARVYDTMLVEQLRYAGYAGVKFSLLETARRYNIDDMSKEERLFFVELDSRPGWKKPLPTEQIAYITRDIDVPYLVAEQQAGMLVELSLMQVAAIEMRALPALAAMELQGVRVDVERWKRAIQATHERRLSLEQSLIEELSAALLTVRMRAYENDVQVCKDWQAERKAFEKSLMASYRQVASRYTWKCYHKESMAAWEKENPAPEKPMLTRAPINLASPGQVFDAFNALGIPVLSTQDAELYRYAARFPIVGRFRRWKELAHFESCFGENLLAHVEDDGRIHASFGQLGAVSGRIICREPNLQQIPKPGKGEGEDVNLRRCFVAEDGYKLLVADLPNIELRILADVSRDPVMLRLFAEGKNLHAETAKLMFNLPADTDTKKHLYKGQPVYQIAKTINFGLVYGMGAASLGERVGLDEETAKKLVRDYFATYRGVSDYLKASPKQSMQQGYAVTLGGRKRFIPDRHTSDSYLAGRMERSAKNHPIQGTNADILKRALALLHASLPDGCHLVLTVHDEIVIEAREDRVSEAEGILKRAMVEACKEFLQVVDVPEPDVLIGDFWQKD